MGRRLLKRGGARLARERVSVQLKGKQCEDLICAAYVAYQIGQPLNRFITILWERGGIDPRDNAAVTGHFIKLAKDWARRHGYKMCWAWVQEHGEINGAHIHILLHVPCALAKQFSPMPLRWIKQILPGAYVAGVCQSQKIGTAAMPETAPIAYKAELMAKVHYMLKCAPAALESDLAMAGWRTPYSKHWGQRCIVYGKRLGIWQGWRAGAV
jgi:hypothetical protein